MNTDLAEEYLIQALRLEAHGQLDKAIQYYKKAYKLKPSLESRFYFVDVLNDNHRDESHIMDNDGHKEEDSKPIDLSLLNQRCSKCKYPRVIAVGGPSRCGKSTLARKFQEQYAHKCVILYQDHFFNKNIPKDEKSGYQNWEIAEAINWKRLQQAILSVLEDNKISCKEHEDEFSSSASTTLESNPTIIVVEGHLLFQPFMMSLYDRIVFLKIDRETCWKRRMETNPVHPDYFDGILWPSGMQQTEYVMEFMRNDNGKNKSVVLDGTQPTERVLLEAIKFLLQS